MRILKNLNDYISFITLISFVLISFRFMIFGLIDHDSSISLNIKDIYKKYLEYNDNEDE